MSYIHHDPDEWTTEIKMGGQPGAQFASYGMVRRPPEEVARIKAERLRREEDDILARAEIIKAARAAAGAS